MTLLALLIACPLGIGSAIYLVEYAKKDNKFIKIVRLTTETLSGIPSIIYGLFGMLLFSLLLKLAAQFLIVLPSYRRLLRGSRGWRMTL